ncbi:MAG TPA: YfiR family protein [Steroidobacteraceae bacterium]
MAALLVWMVSSTTALADYGFGHHAPGDMEANFLLNLFRFVRWPHGPTDTATICFLKPSTVQARLEFGLSRSEPWAQITGRRVIVRMLAPTDAEALAAAEDTAGCQVLFLDAHTADRFWPALAAVHLPPALLTVSTQSDFAYHGGMIEILWSSADTYRILINQANVARADVIVSGALGTLADRVDDARHRY